MSMKKSVLRSSWSWARVGQKSFKLKSLDINRDKALSFVSKDRRQVVTFQEVHEGGLGAFEVIESECEVGKWHGGVTASAKLQEMSIFYKKSKLEKTQPFPLPIIKWTMNSSDKTKNLQANITEQFFYMKQSSVQILQLCLLNFTLFNSACQGKNFEILTVRFGCKQVFNIMKPVFHSKSLASSMNGFQRSTTSSAGAVSEPLPATTKQKGEPQLCKCKTTMLL